MLSVGPLSKHPAGLQGASRNGLHEDQNASSAEQFHARLGDEEFSGREGHVGRERACGETFDSWTKIFDLLRRKKRRGAAALVQLIDSASPINFSTHHVHFALEMREVGKSYFVVFC